MLTQNLAEYWEKLYKKKKDSWSLGHSTPAMLEFFDHPACPKSGRVLVPGAGMGYDAAEWARRGYETLAVDFAQTAFESLCKWSDELSKLSVLKLDLFDLSPKSTESFDIVYEYACFSSIHPGRRDEYFEIWHKMLKDDGLVIAIFYPLIEQTNLEGPPHPTSELELMARLDGVFEIVDQIVPTQTTEARQGQEQIWLLKKANQ